MKRITNLFKGTFTALIILVALAFVGSEIFQGQTTSAIFNYDENDPLIDRPTREALLHVQKGSDNSSIITDTAGYDNFEIGINFAEQMLVSNPRNPLQMQFGVNASSGQSAYYTANGHDWTVSNPTYHSSTCCDPWSAWDSLGVLHYGSGVNGQYIYKSTNGGQTYGPAVLSVSGNDRNTLATDQTNGPYSNYLYAAITPGNFSRSTDGGTSWTTTFNSSNTVPGVMIAVGPNGSVQGGTVMYVTNTGSTASVNYNFFRSIDGGATFDFRTSMNVAGYVGTLNTQGRLVINNGRTRPYPMIAMDNSYGPHRGRLYLVYASNVPAGNGNKPDVILQYSDDQGSTWSSMVTVNDNANPELSDQWFPAIWCVKETGRLYIKWYDTREAPSTYGVNVYATYTDNGGQTFAPNQKLTTQMWTYPTPACGVNQNCYRGDYDGMTANPKTSFSVWYDGRFGNYSNIGAYFPDYAMKVNPVSATINGSNFTTFRVYVPSVKLYTDVTTFTTSITPTPAGGALTVVFPNGNTLNSYPDSLLVRVNAAPNTTAGAYTVTITGAGSNGTPVHKRTVALSVGLVGITGVNEVPENFSLSQNYPNPFNPSTKISYSLKQQTNVKINIFDATGRTVAVINKGIQASGSHSIDFDATALSTGIYYYRLETEFFTDTKKMLLLK